MIVVKVELHSAITGKVSEIGRMVIANDATGDRRRGNYRVRLFRRGSTKSVTRAGDVKGHARLSSSVWVLVAKALASVGFKVMLPAAKQETCKGLMDGCECSKCQEWDDVDQGDHAIEGPNQLPDPDMALMGWERP